MSKKHLDYPVIITRNTVYVSTWKNEWVAGIVKNDYQVALMAIDMLLFVSNHITVIQLEAGKTIENINTERNE